VATLLVAIGFGVTLIALGGTVDLDARALLAKAIWLISLVGALPAAVSLAGSRPEARRGVTELAELRGTDPSTLQIARHLASVGTLLRIVLTPGLALCVVAASLSVDLRQALGHLALVLPVALYATLLALVLGALAHASARLVPEHGRFALLATLLVPHAARALWPNTPSVPAALDWLLRTSLGGGVL
jgi:hypothetical protein